MEYKKVIEKFANDLGFSKVGFASLEKNSPGAKRFEEWISKGFAGEMKYLERGVEKRKNPELILRGAKSVIVLGWDYSLVASAQWSVLSEKWKSPFISRYAWGEDYHEILGPKLLKLEEKLEQFFPGNVFRSYVDTGPVMEKDWAAKAGLGWLGKHTNLIDHRKGSYFFLASLLTTLDLDSEEPIQDHCGTCTRCIDICPTQAIVAPYVLDARLCISYLTIELKGSIPIELRKAIGNHVFGCDDCQEVCPWNHHAKLPEEFLRNVSVDELHEWLQLDEKQFKEKFKDSPILRSKRRGFLRNVCVVLGNRGRFESIPFLKQALQDSEALIREHAAWALQEIIKG